jgi:hypothetical protein
VIIGGIMNYVEFALAVLLVLSVFIGITKIIMNAATLVGNRIGFFDFIINLYRKLKNG